MTCKVCGHIATTAMGVGILPPGAEIHLCSRSACKGTVIARLIESTGTVNRYRTVPRTISAERVEAVIESTAMAYGVTSDQIKSSLRTGHVAHARHMAIYLLRTKESMTYKAIAQAIGRDHSSVMFGFSKIHNWVELGLERAASDADAIWSLVEQGGYMGDNEGLVALGARSGIST